MNFKFYRLLQSGLIISLICLSSFSEYYGLYDSAQSSKFLLLCVTISIMTITNVICFLRPARSKRLFRIYWFPALVLIFTGFITVNRYLIQEHPIYSTKYFELIGLIILLLITRQLKKSSFYWLFLAFIFCGFLQCFIGFLQLVGYFNTNNPFFRLTGSFFNPGPFAGYLAAILPVTIGFGLYQNNVPPRLKVFITICKNPFFLKVVGITLFLFVCLAQSRAAFFASAISTLFLLLYKFNLQHYIQLSRRARYMVVILAVGCCVGVFGMYQLKKKSGDGRLLIWSVSLNMVREHLFLGTGYDSFKGRYMDYQAKYFQRKDNHADVADDVIYTFNDPLQFFIENGLIGVILIVLIMKQLFFSARTDPSPLHVVCLSGLISILIFSLFSYPSQILPIKICGTIYLAYLSKRIRQLPIGSFSVATKTFNYLVGPLVLITVITALYGTVVGCKNYYKAYNNWFIARSLAGSGAFEQALGYYEKAYSHLDHEGTFLGQYGSSLSIAGLHDLQALKVLQDAEIYGNNSVVQISLGNTYKKMGDMGSAEKCYLQARFMAPRKFYPLYLLAKLYVDEGEITKARAFAKLILDKPVTVKSPAIDEIKLQMEKILQDSL